MVCFSCGKFGHADDSCVEKKTDANVNVDEQQKDTEGNRRRRNLG